MEPVQAALEALQTRYAALLEAVAEAEAQTDRAGLIAHLFSGHSCHPGLDEALKTYGPALDGALEALLAALAALPPEEAAEPARQALELLLFYPKPRRMPEEMVLVAFEGKGEALLPWLPAPVRAALADRYRLRTPPRRMLPNQKKLWRALGGKSCLLKKPPGG